MACRTSTRRMAGSPRVCGCGHCAATGNSIPFTADEHYPTNFGDTTLPAGAGSSYSRMHMQIYLERSDPTIFWKLTGSLYLMMLVSAFMFLLSSNDELATAERLDGLQNRLGLLSGGLFIVVLNMQQPNTVVGSTSGLTLIDELYLNTLTLLLISVIGTVLIWRATVCACRRPVTRGHAKESGTQPRCRRRRGSVVGKRSWPVRVPGPGSGAGVR